MAICNDVDMGFKAPDHSGAAWELRLANVAKPSKTIESAKLTTGR